MTAAYVAFGANLGDPAALYRTIAERLGRLPGVESVRSSRLYRTRPVGGPAGQGDYANGCLELIVDSTVVPAWLHAGLTELEIEFGRQRGKPQGQVEEQTWAARPVDLDLLLFGDRVSATESLLVPHPRFHYRAFALEPLAELAPAARHPLLDQTAGELAALARAPDTPCLIVGETGEPPAEAGCAGSLVRMRLPGEASSRVEIVAVGEVPVGVRIERDLIEELKLPETGVWAALYADMPRRRTVDPVAAAIVLPCVDCRAPSAAERARHWRNFLDSLQSVVDSA